MGFWPFGGGKRQRVTDTKRVREQTDPSGPSDNMGRFEKVSTDVSATTRPSAKAGAKGKPQRPSKTRASNDEVLPNPQTAPVVIPSPRKLSRNVSPLSEKALYQQNPISQSSLGPENFNVVRQAPTLHARRPEQDSAIARRKSSKRKAEDYAREREVRAMSSSPIPIPRRPTSFYDSPLQREVREIPGGLDRKLHRPSSQVSLPLLEPWPNFENRPYQNSFKISMFAALSPRPTIKYDGRSQNARGKQPQRPNPLNNPAIAEESGDLDTRRINELADDLDAGGLRELMERDKRRRERKKQQDQAKLQRRLQRRAEKQREEEARKARTEEYVSASASRIRGLGIDQRGDEAVVAESSGYRKGVAENPFADQQSQPASASAIRNPFEDEKEDTDAMQDPGSDRERGPVVPTRSPLRKIRTDRTKDDAKPSQAALSPPTSPAPRPADRQSMSQGSFLNREFTGDAPESASLTGAASDHSSQRLSSWTAFFRRGTRRKLSASFQGRSTPSEFSNTSRESFARKQPPPIVTPRTFRRVDSATPQRTRSKFREDLPELPISPPDSRMQSPETTVPPATSLFSQAVTELPRGTAEETDTSAFTPSSPIPTGEERQENQPPMELDPAATAKPGMMLSQSLASVDSEGSWLSGKPLNRRSGASQRLKGSRSSLTRPMPGASDGGNDALPSPTTGRMDRPAGASEDTEADEMWHAGVGRQATLVPQASRAKSKEGLLNEYMAKEQHDSSPDDEDSDGDDSPEQGELEVTLMRARSVEYKGNARRISAGSAKLLDIKRSSMHSGELLSQPVQGQASSSEAQAPKEDTSAS